MNFWIKNPGFPVVDVQLDHVNSKIRLAQRRFRSNYDATSDAEDKLKVWPIPFSLAYKTQSGKMVSFETLFNSKSLEIDVPANDPILSLKINPQNSFYLYNADVELIRLISKNFEFLVGSERTNFFHNLKHLVLLNFSTTYTENYLHSGIASLQFWLEKSPPIDFHNSEKAGTN